MSSGSKAVAIVGMSCIFPGAANLAQYWQNIVNSVDAVREPGEQEWDARFYRSKSNKQFGNVYCSKAGFITEYADFDPLEFGIMPASLRGGDPDQFLSLRVAAEALRDAGYQHKTFNAERAEIIIGRTMAPGVGSLNLIQHGQTVDQVINVLKTVAPELNADELNNIAAKLRTELQPCNADTIPAVMPNILSGRIASKLGFRGRNLILDAACASSLIAVETAMQGLLSGQSDLAIAGGVHVNSSPYFFQMFCELGAVSNTGTIRPFDENADGTMLGEGVGMVVLKRLEDAVKDNNRIYAVLRGVGSSSDGRGGTSLAPSVEGEALAMRRAYEMAEIPANTVELYEAHGTGTRAGDKAEMKAVQEVFGLEKSASAYCALGSVKSMIGHTQAASGIAGLIKAALALYHKVLPPTLHFSKPSSQIDWNESPCYVNLKTKDWDSASTKRKHPRRAAVSAFGFGGVNAHAVLEEHQQTGKVQALAAPPEMKSASTVKLLLRYPELSGRSLEAIELSSRKKTQAPATAASAMPVTAGATRTVPSSNSPAAAMPLTTVPRFAAGSSDAEDEMILQGYMQTLATFQKNLLGVQEQVILSYLEDEQD